MCHQGMLLLIECGASSELTSTWLVPLRRIQFDRTSKNGYAQQRTTPNLDYVENLIERLGISWWGFVLSLCPRLTAVTVAGHTPDSCCSQSDHSSDLGGKPRNRNLLPRALTSDSELWTDTGESRTVHKDCFDDLATRLTNRARPLNCKILAERQPMLTDYRERIANCYVEKKKKNNNNNYWLTSSCRLNPGSKSRYCSACIMTKSYTTRLQF